MIRRIIVTICILLFIGSLTSLFIAYGKGYRFNYKEKSLTQTGILSASSYPQNASIHVDNKLMSATNASLSLAPAWYDVKISKEGYQSWEKKIRVQGEVVSTIDVLLLPTNPSFKTLTTSGVLSPALSPSGSRVAYVFLSQESTTSATTKLKNGIYVLDLRSGPLGTRSDPKPLFTQFAGYDWKNADLIWSFDEKQILLSFSKTDAKKTIITSSFLVDTENSNTPPVDVTLTREDQIALWNGLKQEKEDLDMANLPASLSATLKSATDMIKFAPDESKIFYHATSSATIVPIIRPALIGTNPTAETRTITAGKYYVFDLKEDKNFFLSSDIKSPDGSVITGWYSDSKHLAMIEKNTISFIDYDGTNKRSLYSGPFVDNIVYPWATGGKIVILTNFNNPTTAPNFYEIDLR